jgi:hypothetical protein
MTPTPRCCSRRLSLGLTDHIKAYGCYLKTDQSVLTSIVHELIYFQQTLFSYSASFLAFIFDISFNDIQAGIDPAVQDAWRPTLVDYSASLLGNPLHVQGTTVLS